MTYIEVLTQAAAQGYRSVQTGGQEDIVSAYEQAVQSPPMEWALITEEMVLHPQRRPDDQLQLNRQEESARILQAAVPVASLSMLHPHFLGASNDLHTDRERLQRLIAQSGARPADLPSLGALELPAGDLSPQQVDEIQRATVTALRRATALLTELPALAALVQSGDTKADPTTR
jgi:hypothetical protein